MKDSKDLYQKIYDVHKWYGDASIDRCPGSRLFPIYKYYLDPVVVDLGCGRGDTVRLMQKNGIDSYGIDQIEKDPEMQVGNITEPLEINATTALCMDVIEHIIDEQLVGLFENFKKTKKQVFSIHNGTSVLDGIELHVNRKPFNIWDQKIIDSGFNIVNSVMIHAQQKLYLTETRN